MKRSHLGLASLAFVVAAAAFLLDSRRAPGDEGGGGAPDEDWTTIHERRAESGRERLRGELRALEEAMAARSATWADLEEKVAERERALAESRADGERRLAEAKAEAARLTHGHDLYAAGMDRAAALYEPYEDLELHVNKLQADIQYLESCIPIVRERLTELDELGEPEERAALARSLQDDILAPLEAKREALGELAPELERALAARKSYYDFHESRMQSWMDRMGKAQGRVKLLEEEIADLELDLEEDRPELALDEAEAAWWRAGTSLRAQLAAKPAIETGAAGASKCVLCHFTSDEGYWLSGRLAYAEHRQVPGDASGDCANCHGGDASSTRVAAAHEGLVPTGLVGDAWEDGGTGPTRREAGEEAWANHRCESCHSLAGEGPRRRPGTQLDGLNGWARYDWIVRWLVDPESYARHPAMPRYALAEPDAQRVALFLWQFAHSHHHHHHAGAAAETTEHAVDQKPEDAGHGHGDGHAHEHAGPPIAPTITGYDVKAGRTLFETVGCLGCHSIRRESEPVGVTAGLASEGRRLHRDFPPGRPYLRAGTVIDEEVVGVLRSAGVRTIEVLSDAPLTPDLVDQRARLAAPYPADDPVFPAGTVIDREVYDFLKAEKVARVALSGRGDGFAPDLTFAGDKLKKAHLTMWIENPVVHQAEATMPVFGLSQLESWHIATWLQELHDPKGYAPVTKGLWKDLASLEAAGLRFDLSASAPVLAAGPEVALELTVRFPGAPDPLGADDIALLTATLHDASDGEPIELLSFLDPSRNVYQFHVRFAGEGPHRLRVSMVAAPGSPPILVEFPLVVRPKSESLEEAGQALARDLSCGSCHVIPGVEAPPRRDLTAAIREKRSSLPAPEFERWLVDRVRHHRLPGAGDVDSYALGEARSRSIAAYVLDRVRRSEWLDRPTALQILTERARIAADRYNCQGCHRLGGPGGGTIGPDLSLAGLRFHATYLERYLAAPRRVRPENGTAIMPTFALSAAEREDLVLWLAARGRASPALALVQAGAAAGPGDPERGRKLVEEFRCRSCHLIGTGETKYVDDTTDYTLAELARHRLRAPRLVDLASRLDPAWMAAWIKDPHQFQPDTPMPDHEFTLEDAVAIRDWLLGQVSAPAKTNDEPRSHEGASDR